MKEIFIDIKGYEGYYQVSNFGNIKSLQNSNLIMKQDDCSKYGHKRVQLTKNGKTRKLVHRLVAEAFIPNPENKPQVNHIDNNPRNNRVDNLEWCTVSENLLHAQKQGRLTAAQRKGGEAQAKKAQAQAKETAKSFIGKTISGWEIISYYGNKPIGNITREALNCRCINCKTVEVIEHIRLTNGTLGNGCRQCSTTEIAERKFNEYVQSIKGTIIGTWKITGITTPFIKSARKSKFQCTCVNCGNTDYIPQPSIIGTKKIKSCNCKKLS